MRTPTCLSLISCARSARALNRTGFHLPLSFLPPAIRIPSTRREKIVASAVPPRKYLISRGVAKFPALPQKILKSTFPSQVPAFTIFTFQKFAPANEKQRKLGKSTQLPAITNSNHSPLIISEKRSVIQTHIEPPSDSNPVPPNPPKKPRNSANSGKFHFTAPGKKSTKKHTPGGSLLRSHQAPVQSSTDAAT